MIRICTDRVLPQTWPQPIDPGRTPVSEQREPPWRRQRLAVGSRRSAV